jgi:hypothetical protein
MNDFMKRIFALIFPVVLFFGLALAARAEDANAPLLINTPTVGTADGSGTEAPTPTLVDPAPAPRLTILTAVARGKELLAPVFADFKKKEPGVKPVATKTSQTAAAIALWDKTADTVTVWGGTRGLRYFTADAGGWQIPIVTTAGAQTAFRGKDPNLVVVGTVQADMVPVTIKKKKQYKPTFSYYVPYNKSLYSVETLAAGSDYLSSLIQEAFVELDAKGITSRAFPGQLLTAAIDPYLIKSIAVIEHADGQIYEDDAAEESLGRFLVKLALNQEHALGTATSTAGARGMAQFIPSTYKLMVTKRPDLGLIADFAAGMADHGNAIKAEAAYLDMILADLPQEIRDRYLSDRGSAASYIAAGYNGGSVRVKRAIATWGEDWSVSHAADYDALAAKAASLKSRIAQIDKQLNAGVSDKKEAALRAEKKKAQADRSAALARAGEIKGTWIVKETASYVVKLRRVYGMLAAGFFATPNAPTNTVPVAAAPANPDLALAPP